MERAEHQLADEFEEPLEAFVEAVCMRDPDEAEREAERAFNRAAVLIETVPDFPFVESR